MLAASHRRHCTSYASAIAVINSQPPAPTLSATASAAEMLSLGCAGSFDRYVSLKSKERMPQPLANAAQSGGALWSVPKIVDPWLAEKSPATLRAITNGS